MISLFLFSKVVEELQALKGKRAEKVQQAGTELFKLSFSGNNELLLDLGKRLNLTKYKVAGTASPAAMLLRKHLQGLRLESIAQEAGRVAVLNFGCRKLAVELFSHGNLVLTDADWRILWCFRSEEWKGRRVARGEEYVLPQNPVPPLREDYSPLTKDFVEKHASVNEAVDEYYAGLPAEKPRLAKLERRLAAQEKALQDFQKQAGELRAAADLIKANFEKIEEARKKHKAKFMLEL